MRFFISAAIAACALSATAWAQDSTVKSRTNIKADDARVLSMTGCLRDQVAPGVFALDGTMAAAGKKIETNSKVKTDVDKDKTTVRGRTETKADDGAVATSGSTSTFLLVPGSAGVDLASHVGERVQISAIMVNPGHGDADVKIKEKTRVDAEHAPDAKSESTTKTELPRTGGGQYTVMSMTSTGVSCAR
jgi:hypothetical protein